MSYTPHNFKQNVSSAKKIIEVSNNKFKNEHPSVLYFTAPWCGPCKKISPHFEKLAEQNSGIKFFKINVDDNQKLASDYKISSIPTFVFINKKNEETKLTTSDSKLLSDYMKIMLQVQ